MQGAYDEAAIKSFLGKLLEGLPRGGQTALAHAAGVQPQTVNKWKKGDICPSPDKWPAIERYLNLPDGKLGEVGGWPPLRRQRLVPLATTAPPVSLTALEERIARLEDLMQDIVMPHITEADRSQLRAATTGDLRATATEQVDLPKRVGPATDE